MIDFEIRVPNRTIGKPTNSRFVNTVTCTGFRLYSHEKGFQCVEFETPYGNLTFDHLSYPHIHEVFVTVGYRVVHPTTGKVKKHRLSFGVDPSTTELMTELMRCIDKKSTQKVIIQSDRRHRMILGNTIGEYIVPTDDPITVTSECWEFDLHHIAVLPDRTLKMYLQRKYRLQYEDVIMEKRYVRAPRYTTLSLHPQRYTFDAKDLSLTLNGKYPGDKQGSWNYQFSRLPEVIINTLNQEV